MNCNKCKYSKEEFEDYWSLYGKRCIIRGVNTVFLTIKDKMNCPYVDHETGEITKLGKKTLVKRSL